MKNKYKYQPEIRNSQEFYRIQQWWNTFNAALQSALVETSLIDGAYCREDVKEARKAARKVANSVHGSIKKPSADKSKIKVGDEVRDLVTYNCGTVKFLDNEGNACVRFHYQTALRTLSVCNLVKVS